MRATKRRLVVAGVAAFLLLGGVAFGALRLSAAQRHAARSVADIERAIPGATGYRVGPCRRSAGGRVSCAYRMTFLAVGGGTVTCTSRAQVHSGQIPVRAHGRTRRVNSLVTTFPARPKCVFEPARPPGA